MYPILRLAKEVVKFKYAPALNLDDVHVSSHICWPVDIDIFGELNNGRTLTLYDLGRLVMGQRMGWLKLMKENKWGMTMAGASVRYRRRVKVFQKFEIHSKPVGRDEKFIYINQSMWRGDLATSSILYRTAVTDKNGIVPTQTVADVMGCPDWNPEMPEWVTNWVAAEDTRTWPPTI